MASETPEERAARRKRLNFLCNSTDPLAMESRVFVGSIDTERDVVTKADVMDMFSPYGRVYDVSIHKGYFFVQYDNIDSARSAVDKMNRTKYKRSIMDVKLAITGRKENLPPPDDPENCRFFQQGYCMRGDKCLYKHEITATRPPEREREPEHLPMKRPIAERDDYPPPARRRVAPEYDSYSGRPLYDDPYPPPFEPYPPPPVRREPPPIDLRPPYDCVLIAGSELQRAYCMSIEKRLLDFGMLTNVQVVDGDHLLKRAVEEAAHHNVPYTICVTQNNEQHRSLTLNILHGVPQEHRNMPLEDAMPFLSRNFDQFVEMMKQKIAAINDWKPPNAQVTYLLNLLADGRRLTLAELEDVMAYISSTLAKAKGGEASISQSQMMHSMNDSLLPEPRARPVEPLPPPISDSSRAMSMKMGDLLRQREMAQSVQPYDAHRPYNVPTSMSSNGTGASGINFSSPAVQRALDDLLAARPNFNAPAVQQSRYY